MEFLGRGIELRGKCKELSEKACEEDETLMLVRGHYYCPYVNKSYPHWWTMKADGSIHDPTKQQFLSNGQGEYMPFNGIVECAQCGKEMSEDDASFYGNYAFCGMSCQMRFVGL